MWHYDATGERRDSQRDSWMAARGLRTVRVSASRLAKRQGDVLDWIYEVATKRIEELGGAVNPVGRRSPGTCAPPPSFLRSDTYPARAGEEAEPAD